MRTNQTLKSLAILPMLLVALTASADNGIGVTELTTSDCKENQNTQTRSAAPEEGEWIDYSVTRREDGLYLHIVHENIYLNCATLGAECSAKIEGSVITMDEQEKTDENWEPADCLCPHDVTYEVGPLTEGDYTLVITFYGNKIAEAKVHVSEPLRGRLNVDSFVAKIESSQAVSADRAIYDLRGRRYSSFPFPGVFIQNGKKVVWREK